MRIHIAADFGGYRLGRELESALAEAGDEPIWHGPDEYQDGDDYPVYAVRVGAATIADQDAGRDARGILVVGDLVGGLTAADKVNGVRAVPALDDELIADARATVDVNVLVIPGRTATAAAALGSIRTFLDAPFRQSLDDARRIVYTGEYENSGTIEGWNVEVGA